MPDTRTTSGSESRPDSSKKPVPPPVDFLDPDFDPDAALVDALHELLEKEPIPVPGKAPEKTGR